MPFMADSPGAADKYGPQNIMISSRSAAPMITCFSELLVAPRIGVERSSPGARLSLVFNNGNACSALLLAPEERSWKK